MNSLLKTFNSSWAAHESYAHSRTTFHLYATCTSPIMHLICPPKFCIAFVFHLLQPFQEKWKTMRQFFFCGEGTNHFRSFSKLVWKSISNEHKIIAWSYWPCVTPNDYVNIVFHLAVSLRGSCRNNALPRIPTGKASTFTCV